MSQAKPDDIFKITLSFINNTNKSVFLTGKAGTGKTTFLNFLKENTSKKFAIVAPTGIAALNAGGITINSFFNIPYGPFYPNKNQFAITVDSKKRRLLQELELLVIDEVSMLRADMLDAIDYVLRTTRRQPNLPFAGIQILYVGDLYQLSPVISTDEWQQLKIFYAGISFLYSNQLKKERPIRIELEHVYRQSDGAFIALLNAIRTGTCDNKQVDMLNNRYRSSVGNNHILLTTHNNKASLVNSTAINNLAGDEYNLMAEINGDFDEESFPTEKCLKLKIGARVMLLRNDKSKNKKYYNGKTGLIKSIDPEKLSILFDDGEQIEIEQEIWLNQKYNYNESSGIIETIETGSFKQFPVRLAWAITIHKSQGLTLENAVIDLKDVFVPGQVYVALSRIKSLDGVILSSKVTKEIINNAVSISEHLLLHTSNEAIEKLLASEKNSFAEKTLKNLFDWSDVVSLLSENKSVLDDYVALQNATFCIRKCNEISLKFHVELTTICGSEKHDKYEILKKRIKAAASYYLTEIDNKILNVIREEFNKTKNNITLKLKFRFNKELKLLIENKRQDLLKAETFVSNFR